MFQGSIVALVSPFGRDGQVDETALEGLIDWHVASGTSALVIAGTTGESATLDKDEHVALIATAARIAAGRVPIIAGTGSNSTAQTVALSQAVDKLDVDAFLLVAPYYNKPTQEGLFQHFSAVADAVEKPVLLYNVPGRTCSDVLPETVARLAQHPRIVGIKDATGDVGRLQAMLDIVDAEDFVYLSGDDFTTLAFIRAGGRGCISVTANVAPAKMARLCAMALDGEGAAANTLDAELQPLHEAMFVESNPIPVKWALESMGRIEGSLRLPLTALGDAYRPGVQGALAEAGLV
ncbi:MAG: 4-hydroxy-tetrahydrodipicolinate synthase [Pseudomonadota bacterium]